MLFENRLKESLLFKNMTAEEFTGAMSELGIRTRRFAKGEYILHMGDTTDSVGIVMEGTVRIERSDLFGNRTIIGQVDAGDVFAESYAILGIPMYIDVAAKEPCTVRFVRIDDIIQGSWNSGLDVMAPPDLVSSWKIKFLSSLLKIACKKNIGLSQRNFHTTPKTVRGRIVSYLNAVSIQMNSRDFDIPFDRQHLADYLNLDRSALSKELGRMRDDGIIVFSKNHFTILIQEQDQSI